MLKISCNKYVLLCSHVNNVHFVSTLSIRNLLGSTFLCLVAGNGKAENRQKIELKQMWKKRVENLSGFGSGMMSQQISFNNILGKPFQRFHQLWCSYKLFWYLIKHPRAALRQSCKSSEETYSYHSSAHDIIRKLSSSKVFWYCKQNFRIHTTDCEKLLFHSFAKQNKSK